MIKAALNPSQLLEPLRRIHERVREAVVAECEKAAVEQLAEVSDDESEGDTIYAIDRVSEELLVELFEHELATFAPLVLVAEGIEGGELVLPRGTAESDAVWRIVVDPIDGTRGLMYQKRSAWVLTGVAENRGAETNLQEIVLAIQTEIPLVKQHLCDTLWAVRGEGAHAERFNRLSNERQPLLCARLAPRAFGMASPWSLASFPALAMNSRRLMRRLCAARWVPSNRARRIASRTSISPPAGNFTS